MNIYLDIDGVLLINEQNAPLGAGEFLKFIMSNYSESTYWLTTHCWQGINRTADALEPAFGAEILKLIKTIKPTEWGEFKTDAINNPKDNPPVLMV